MRKILTSFEIFSQSDGPVRKPNQSIHWVLFAEKQLGYFVFFCVGSWPFGVKIAFNLFFWIQDSMRNFLTNFEIFSEPARPVGKPNQPVHWVIFVGIAVWVLFFVCVGS